METIPQELINHQNKCRCCFRLLKKFQKTVEITNSIEKRFEKLTNVKLIMANSYSSVVCESCNSKLSEFADFQNELIENQMSLYQHIKAYDEEYLEEALLENIPEEQYLISLELKSEPLTPITDPKKHVEESKLTESIIVVKEEQREKTNLKHKTTQQWLCIMCSESFRTKSLLQVHKKGHKDIINTDQSEEKKKQRKMCQLCGLSFAQNGWYHHILRAHTETCRYFCDFCGKGYKVKHDLKDHIRTHISVDSRQKFYCPVCNAALLSKSALKNHEQIFHAEFVEVHSCDCGKVFASKMKLYQHRLTVHMKGHFPCPFCDKAYTVKSALQKHIVKNHKTKVPCEICGKMFAPGMFMNKHMKSHGPPEFRCSFEGCGKEFHSKSSLGYHFDSQHKANVEVTCPTCNATYNSAKNLNRHIARQHSNYRVQCEVEGCSHTSARKDYLAAHYRSHKDIDEDTKNILLAKIKEIKVIPW